MAMPAMPTRMLVLMLAMAMLAGCASGPVGNSSVPEPAKAVDVERYVGRWYELARYENRFERGCEGVTADYKLRPDGSLDVVNTCREGTTDGKSSSADGHATVVPDSNGAKLEVSFFWPFYGDYWVLDRGDDYEWAIVGEPGGTFLWILSRDATPPPEVMEGHIKRVRELGYDTKLLRITAQPPA